MTMITGMHGYSRSVRARINFALLSLAPREWAVVRARIELECTRIVCRPEFAPTLVSQYLLVSGEDHRHAGHPGFDLIAIGRALWRRLAHGSHEGASTIEQQIVRTITQRYERTIWRKLSEIHLAILVSRSFRKDALPAVYLAIAYYGWRMNNYRQACMRLGLQPSSLTLEDAAGLVARLKYPEPRTAPLTRRLQINHRTKHLIDLHRRHMHDGTYRHLNGTTLRSRSPALSAPGPISQP